MLDAVAFSFRGGFARKIGASRARANEDSMIGVDNAQTERIWTGGHRVVVALLLWGSP
ncbi:MAG: hypothetical protein JO369_06520 [Paucibacter sp.]|nr:hypothetical protein [Roseateles sp.]